MGQKVHPLGFRINITQKHRSIWFAKFNTYANFLEEDYKIRQTIQDLLKRAKVTKIIIGRDNEGKTLNIEIHTALPALVVGKEGSGLKMLHKSIKQICQKNTRIKLNLIQIENESRDATLLAAFLVDQLENRVAFRRALKITAQRANVNIDSGEGIKIQISGRLNGAEIARSEWSREGRVPLQTIRADIDYAYKIAQTIYGLLGIKIWFFKGEIR